MTVLRGTFLQFRNIGVLNAYILPISRNVKGAIAPPVPGPLYLQDRRYRGARGAVSCTQTLGVL